MNPPVPHSATADPSLRHLAQYPRDSDGVGNALRQIFRDTRQTPPDLSALLNRLNDND